MREICKKIRFNSCFCRHPKEDFVRALGEDTVKKLMDLGYLKLSAKRPEIHDYYQDEILQFSNKFRRIFDYHAWPLKSWLKINVLHYYEIKWWITKKYNMIFHPNRINLMVI